jgi:hypothetical protein
MGSGSMMYIRSFIKIGSGIQKLIRQDTKAPRETENGISLFQETRLNNKRGLKFYLAVCISVCPT